MKKLVYILVLSIFVTSCKEESDTAYVLFSGKIENSNVRKIDIKGNDFETSVSISEDGSFKDTLYIKEKGYYDMRVGEYTNLFLEHGDDISLTVDAKTFDESLTYTGKGAEVNTYLAAKLLLQEQLKGGPQEFYALNEADYKKKLKTIKSALDSLLTASDLKNSFEKLEKENIFYAHGGELLKYPSFHKYYTKKENFEPGESFFDELKTINYEDEAAYTSIPSYRVLVSQKFSENFSKNYEKHDSSTSKAFIATAESLPKGKIKDDMMNRYVGFSLTTDEYMEEVYNTFMAEVQNEEYKTKVEEKYNKIKNLVKGKPSPVFAYENHKGGTTALKDLKGKYVYVDVWATWCGPCKAEIPFLKKLEADYHDNNIEFVSISIDTPNAYEAWKKMVVEKELGGIQLIADNNWKSKFITDYAIEGIPRFILIDPDGNIVNADAPRPSNDKIRALFDELKI